MVFLWYLYGILMVFIWYLYRTYFLPKAKEPQGLGPRLPCQQIVFRGFSWRYWKFYLLLPLEQRKQHNCIYMKSFLKYILTNRTVILCIIDLAIIFWIIWDSSPSTEYVGINFNAICTKLLL